MAQSAAKDCLEHVHFNVKFTAHIRHIAFGKIFFKEDISVKIIILHSSNKFTEILKKKGYFGD
jgi:hypothetical protein